MADSCVHPRRVDGHVRHRYTLPLIAIAALFALMGKRAEGILRPVGDRLVST